MGDKIFQLKPFNQSQFLPDIKITGTVSRQNNNLLINYLLTGDLSLLDIPSRGINPIRQDDLWQETCFEFFLGIPHQSDYWEFNLAPSGNWNIYHFDDYRQGMKQVIAFTTFPFTIECSEHQFKLHCNVNLKSIIPVDETLAIGISAVIKNQLGKISYWALTHLQSEANFHDRDSFVINL